MLTEKGRQPRSACGNCPTGVGLAKSNVLRYFDSREADLPRGPRTRSAWPGSSDLDGLARRPRDRKPNYANEIRVATTVADSLG
mgnify:CR=1 FL=1